MTQIAKKYDITMQTCGEKAIYTDFGVRQSGCVTKELLEDVFGFKLKATKAGKLRDGCGCIHYVDIGAYNTCLHRCKYCYATTDHNKAIDNYSLHDPNSKLILGNISPTDIVVTVNQTSNIKKR